MKTEDEQKAEEIIRIGDFYIGWHPMICTDNRPLRVNGRNYWLATAWEFFPIGRPDIPSEMMKDTLRHSRGLIRSQLLMVNDLVEVERKCRDCDFCNHDKLRHTTRFWDALMFLTVKKRGADDSAAKSVALVADGGTVYPVFGLINVATGQVVGKVANLYTNRFEVVPEGRSIRDVVEHNLHYADWAKTALEELPT